MQVQKIKSEDAKEFSRGAAINAEYRNRINKQRFSGRDQARAETIRDLVGIVYPESRCYVNYRQKFFSVKIENAPARLQRSPQGQQFEAVMEEYKATKIVTPQGILYRIPKEA